MAKKKRGRWDNLKQNKNLKLRRDYINTHYINGMSSITGDKSVESIRALDNEEKDFLNDFYGEYINASFSDHPLNKTSNENKKKIVKLKEESESLEKQIKKLDPVKDMKKRNPLSRRLVDIKSEIIELDAKKDSYNRNNARNRCVLNKGKAINTVEFRNWGEFDQDTISYEDEEVLESNRILDYEEKLKLHKHLTKYYPGMFTFEEIDSLDLELIYEILSSRG